MKKRAEKRGTAKQKLCIYCNSLFDTKIFNKHLQEVHSLPPDTQTQNSERKLLHLSAFGGTVQTYFLEADGDHDFIQFMVDRKQISDEVVEEVVQAEPKKVQLSKKVKLGKTSLRK